MDPVKTGDQILNSVIANIFTPLYQLAVGVAVVYFFYGVFKYISDMNNPEAKTDGKSHLLWGTIGLFIILSVGGILQIFNSVFNGIFTY